MTCFGARPASLCSYIRTYSFEETSRLIHMLANYLKILLVLVCVPSMLLGQTTPTPKDSIMKRTLDDVVISGNKFSEQKKNIAQQIDIIGAKTLKAMNAPTMADVLSQSGKVFVQKSQQGGGSPVIRGFEASRVLLMVDGIRLNNAIFRSGHLQNVITIDNNMLQRIEILNGPASTIHGSDALGGVVLMKTISPRLRSNDTIGLTRLNGLMRFASVNREKTISVGAGWANNTWGTYTHITAGSFDNLRQGKNDPSFQLATWGRDFVVERRNGMDTMVPTDQPYEQLFSGYDQIDILHKMAYNPNPYERHGLNFQFSNTTNIPRYDRLTQRTSLGLAKHAEWYYGPQLRTLAAYDYYVVRKKRFFDEFMLNLSHQRIRESRNTRRFQDDWLNERTERLHVLGFNVAARKKIHQHEITYGGDVQRNDLKSTAEATNIVTSATQKINTRYPDGNNNMSLGGVFVQHTYKFGRGHFVLNDGVRFNATRLQSTIVDTSLFGFPFEKIGQSNTALTANLGLIYFPNDIMRFTINASRGFRSPNIDDMGKIFESLVGERLIVPNENLKPEYTNSLDLSADYKFDNLSISLNGFYTFFQNAIVTDAFSFAGQDSLLYNGILTPVFANQNKAEAFLYGGGVQFKYKFNKLLLMYGHGSYTYGRFIEQGLHVPLDHVPPIFGRFGLTYKKSKWSLETYLLYNGAKRIKDYNPTGEDNLQFALATGTPAWHTYNFRVQYFINKSLRLQAGLDNILDRNYRYFASGISAPGRNVILSLRYSK